MIMIKTNVTNPKHNTVEPLLRGHPDERRSPLERPLYTVNLNIHVLISTPNERPPLLVQKGWPHKRGSTVPVYFLCTFLS